MKWFLTRLDKGGSWEAADDPIEEIVFLFDADTPLEHEADKKGRDYDSQNCSHISHGRSPGRGGGYLYTHPRPPGDGMLDRSCALRRNAQRKAGMTCEILPLPERGKIRLENRNYSHDNGMAHQLY